MDQYRSEIHRKEAEKKNALRLPCDFDDTEYGSGIQARVPRSFYWFSYSMARLLIGRVLWYGRTPRIDRFSIDARLDPVARWRIERFQEMGSWSRESNPDNREAATGLITDLSADEGIPESDRCKMKGDRRWIRRSTCSKVWTRFRRLVWMGRGIIREPAGALIRRPRDPEFSFNSRGHESISEGI